MELPELIWRKVMELQKDASYAHWPRELPHHIWPKSHFQLAKITWILGDVDTYVLPKASSISFGVYGVLDKTW